LLTQPTAISLTSEVAHVISLASWWETGSPTSASTFRCPFP
jgi:hypothetical protein